MKCTDILNMENGYILSLIKWILWGTLSLQLCACEELLNREEGERISTLEFTEYSDSITQGECSQRFLVQRQVEDGSPAAVGSTRVTLRDTGSAIIYSDPECTQAVRDPLEIEEGQHSLEFYILSHDLVDFQISASSSGLDAAEMEIQTIAVVSKLGVEGSERELFYDILLDYLDSEMTETHFILDNQEYEVSFLTKDHMGHKYYIQLKRIDDQSSHSFPINEDQITYRETNL
ncbi:MAG: hypothetical protein HRT44_00775 [Bdellovibrionales bacterium]|nr:hypothetical protein [Bdellovibrionales bacterium]NQZ17783.1 hypothetical protein [Bdellovibrionales bacterium]